MSRDICSDVKTTGHIVHCHRRYTRNKHPAHRRAICSSHLLYFVEKETKQPLPICRRAVLFSETSRTNQEQKRSQGLKLRNRAGFIYIIIVFGNNPFVIRKSVGKEFYCHDLRMNWLLVQSYKSIAHRKTDLQLSETKSLFFLR